ncbi:hypothetical protein AYL99_03302 [Fonsecaea erecta]|uniref:Uncharacterized protein n=1 Tax=Fonsecaea erecta TaxID=1367422 RepID=A0A178ZNQ1_9EURO|nr:hypothetical protein AYL99_03302 [Fonsecaea erecta]OAP61101.1 hypothetical protein AYL99_03302 [Fonsecaea erecta]
MPPDLEASRFCNLHPSFLNYVSPTLAVHISNNLPQKFFDPGEPVNLQFPTQFESGLKRELYMIANPAMVFEPLGNLLAQDVMDVQEYLAEKHNHRQICRVPNASRRPRFSSSKPGMLP